MANECPKCQTNNPDTLKFCGECGTPLEADAIHTKTLETPTEELKRGSVFAGRYEIIEELGKGGMGKVYRVEDTKAKEEIALKLIKPEIAADKKTIERFRNELTTARKIAHRNVCRMFDLGEEKGQHYITMEYVPGGDLKRLIRRTKRLDPGTAISITKQICEGLEEAHHLGIIHRDLKPSNIMIDDNGNVRIMDFGIARTVKAKSITGSGVMIGTPEYMSPEQVEAKEVDQRSDIYSLGIIMYEMLTGRLPFEADTPFAIGVMQKSEIPKSPVEYNPQISEDLNRVILKCLEKKRDNRYQSAREVFSELEKIEQGLPTTDRAIPPKKSLTSREITVSFNVKKLLWPALLFIFVLAAVALFWHPWSKQSREIDSPGQISLAVLPFEDLSAQKDQEAFCDGMTAEIISKLSLVKSWRVLPSTTMKQYKQSQKDLKAIAQELNVSHVLEGQLNREENDLRVNARLIDVQHDRIVLPYSKTTHVDKSFDIQAEIAESIMLELLAELTPEMKQDIEKKPTTSLEAFDLYNKGIEYYLRLRNEDNEQAIVLFKEAIELDPNFAQAYARLADAYRQRHIRFDYPDFWLDESIELSEQAIAIDPDCAEAYQATGAVYSAKGWIHESIIWERKALEKNPNLVIALNNLANNYFNFGDVEQGYHLIKRSLAVDPSRAFTHSQLGHFFLVMGDYKKTEESLGKALLYQPDLASAYMSIIWNHVFQEHYDIAMEYGRKYLSYHPGGDGPYNYMGLIQLFARNYDMALEYFEKTGSRLYRAGLYWKMERVEEAETLLDEDLSRRQARLDRGDEDNLILIYIASNYAVRGNREKAFEWLEKAIAGGWILVKYVTDHPFWEDFYEDERFKQIISGLNTKLEDIRKRIED